MIRDGEGEAFAFVDEASEPRTALARLDLLLDAVEAEPFEAGRAAGRDPKHLFMIRVMSTRERLGRLFGTGGMRPGEWYRVTLRQRAGSPIAWVLPAIGDYSERPVRTNVVDLQRLSPAGPHRGGRKPPWGKLEAWCASASAQASRQISGLVAASALGKVGSAPGRLHVRVLDVGHASCAALHVARDPDASILGYYDVGRPVFFHSGTAPKELARVEGARIPARGFVLLSHWDFDHYSLAVSQGTTGLKGLDWYAPDQPVGPNAAKLQADLGGQLCLLNAPQQRLGLGMRLLRGAGRVGDRNGSGYVLRLDQSRDALLLPGDVGYDLIDPAAKAGLTAMVVTHHGGRGPAPPAGPGHAVVSYGLPNRYGHPDPAQLRAHQAAGWVVSHTFDQPRVRRSDRWLTAP